MGFVNEVLVRKQVEMEQRIADLERQLAETRQYLAVAEGQAKGGPPGWVMDEELGCCGMSKWTTEQVPGKPCMMVMREDPASDWFWRAWVYGNRGESINSGTEETAREAMAAAEAAYQEAIASQGGQ